MKNVLKKLWSDENGLTTLEIIVGAVILGGAAILIGSALVAGGRGKTAEVLTDLDALKAMDDPVTQTSQYTYTVTSGSVMPTDATGQ